MSLRLVTPKTDTFKLVVAIDIPNGPKGGFRVMAKRLSKPEVKALKDEGVLDDEYIPRICEEILDLEDKDGNALAGQAAFDEVISGAWSQYLVHAIVQAYFESYGEVLTKNGNRSRGR